jgi:hypothetical protein
MKGGGRRQKHEGTYENWAREGHGTNMVPWLLFLCGALALADMSLAPVNLWSQVTATGSGVVTGRVTDQSGAIIPGALVELTNIATKSTERANTNKEGVYVFGDVKPAVYTLTVTKTGFQQTVMSGQTVITGQMLTLNATLRVGSTTQTVQVTATPGAQLQTMNATMGNTLTSTTIMQLPTFNRDVTSLLYYQPTAVPDFNGATGNITSNVVAGQTSDQNTYSIDGGNATDDLAGDNAYQSDFNSMHEGTAAIYTPVESVQEFDVSTNNSTASFSSSAGGHAMILTKSGTNAFHGSAYDYFQNSALDSNDWENNFTAQPKPQSTYNRFGAALGGPLLPKMAGGKTYFYVNYEGFRWPQSVIYERDVPSMLLREGIVQEPDANGNVVQYNLKSSTQCGPSGGMPCDPLGLGLNPTISSIWSKYEPLPNDFNAGDHLNTFGYEAPLSIPYSTDFFVGRIDHDFGSKLHWFASYRWQDVTEPTTDQVDIGGLAPGDKFGVPASLSSDPAAPRYFVTGLTETLSPNVTNDFHFSLLRNNWSWNRSGFIPQGPNLSVPVELGEESSGEPSGTTSLIPINVDTQDTRPRYWDSHDFDYRDTVNWLKGDHYFQIGGEAMHDWWHFNRYDDIVSGLANTVIDEVGYNAGEVNMPPSVLPTPCSSTLTSGCLPSGELSSYEAYATDVMGLVNQSDTLATRSGSNLALNPLGQPLASYLDNDFYNLYISDAWKVRPSITINLGLSWGYQAPPYAPNGEQDVLTDANGAILTVPEYLQNRLSAAEAGGTYAPIIGYEPLADVGGGGGLKYPYQPDFGDLGPRVAVAWNPHASGGFMGKILGNDDTVIRGGFSRMYDRIEAISVVTDASLGDGFIEPITCVAPTATGCAGTGNVTPANAFRLGVTAPSVPLPPITPTLTTPVEPGYGDAAYAAGSFGINDNLPTGYSDQFDFSIQRQLKGGLLAEVAYVGNWDSNLYQGVDLDDVPWMMKLGGQTFANAYDNLWRQLSKGTAVTPQPFFETALKPSYCSGYSSCSAAVVANESSNITSEAVTTLWSDLDNSFNFGPQLLSTTQCEWCYYQTSDGYANYNALTATVQKRTGNGLTLSSSFTYSHALGIDGLPQTYTLDNLDDPWDPAVDYGPQYFDHKFIASIVSSYNLPFGPGHRFLSSSNPVIKRVFGGWTLAPIFTYASGQPVDMYTGSFEEFGAGFDENGAGAVPTINTAALSNSAHFGVNPTGAVGFDSAAVNGGSGVNMFSNPAAVFAGFQPCLVGICTSASGAGQLRGPSLWDLDLSINKTTNITERVSVEFFSEWFNAFNHMAWGSDLNSYSLQNPEGFGTLGQFNALQGDYTRVIQLGLRLSF